MFRGSVAAVAVIALAWLAAGCAGVTPTGAVTVPTGVPATPTEACGEPDVESTSMWIEADGAYFDVGVVGDGDITVILTHQVGKGACGFWPYSTLLAEQGIRSLLLNLCGYGETVCAPDQSVMKSGTAAVLAAADWASADGATTVVSMGASMGGTIAVAAAAESAASGRLDGLIDLAGPVAFRGIDTSTLVAQITIPAYFATATIDATISPSSMQGLVDEVSSAQVTVDVDGTGHGWDLLWVDGEVSELGLELAEFMKSL